MMKAIFYPLNEPAVEVPSTLLGLLGVFPNYHNELDANRSQIAALMKSRWCDPCTSGPNHVVFVATGADYDYNTVANTACDTLMQTLGLSHRIGALKGPVLIVSR